MNSEVLAPLAHIVADLSQDLPHKAGYQRLLEALMSSFPCDASAILQLDGDSLVPRAVKGLNPDTLGRRFKLSEQPRLEEIVQSRGIVRFPSDSPLADPYDGLIDTPDHHLYIHDCMGAPLQVDGRTWGVLTLDALHAESFDDVDMKLLETFVAVAAASIRAAELITALESDLQRHQLVQQSWLTDPRESELIGDSLPMQRLRREAEVVGRSGLPVLVLGETGVGKELVARYIHLHSTRASKPMVQVNCAALPENIAESELFGHVSGAFTGATKDRVGKFELAHQGTLLLDEVGELPLPLQAKLLRVLQSGEIQRVGSDNLHHVDVRVIAATNRDLEREVKEQRFRADLYHRLSVYPISVPALRERGADVSQLAGHFLQQCERKFGLRGVRLGRDADRWLTQNPWPGNVRELQHTISRAVVRALGESATARETIVDLSLRHLGAEGFSGTLEPAVDSSNATASAMTLAEATDQFKRELVRRRLRQHKGNLSATAVSLGLDKGNFHRLLKRLGIRGGASD
ncbi:MAG: nitric oxide reductase transcriptional regulator NorR [Gammaproteobacteria bacterium]